MRMQILMQTPFKAREKKKMKRTSLYHDRVNRTQQFPDKAK